MRLNLNIPTYHVNDIGYNVTIVPLCQTGKAAVKIV